MNMPGFYREISRWESYLFSTFSKSHLPCGTWARFSQEDAASAALLNDDLGRLMTSFKGISLAIGRRLHCRASFPECRV